MNHAPPPPITAPIKIDPDGIYTDRELIFGLGIPSSTIERERKAKRLRSTMAGRTRLYRGCWIISWLEREGVDHA